MQEILEEQKNTGRAINSTRVLTRQSPTALIDGDTIVLAAREWQILSTLATEKSDCVTAQSRSGTLVDRNWKRL